MAEFNLATHQSAILKDLGNKMLREGKPEEAMVKYGEAIAAFQREGLHEGMAVCLINRSIVNAKLSRWPESYCDAKLACSLFPRFFKEAPHWRIAVVSGTSDSAVPFVGTDACP